MRNSAYFPKLKREMLTRLRAKALGVRISTPPSSPPKRSKRTRKILEKEENDVETKVESNQPNIDGKIETKIESIPLVEDVEDVESSPNKRSRNSQVYDQTSAGIPLNISLNNLSEKPSVRVNPFPDILTIRFPLPEIRYVHYDTPVIRLCKLFNFPLNNPKIVQLIEEIYLPIHNRVIKPLDIPLYIEKVRNNIFQFLQETGAELISPGIANLIRNWSTPIVPFGIYLFCHSNPFNRMPNKSPGFHLVNGLIPGWEEDGLVCPKLEPDLVRLFLWFSSPILLIDPIMLEYLGKYLEQLVQINPKDYEQICQPGLLINYINWTNFIPSELIEPTKLFLQDPSLKDYFQINSANLNDMIRKLYGTSRIKSWFYKILLLWYRKINLKETIYSDSLDWSNPMPNNCSAIPLSPEQISQKVPSYNLIPSGKRKGGYWIPPLLSDFSSKNRAGKLIHLGRIPLYLSNWWDLLQKVHSENPIEGIRLVDPRNIVPWRSNNLACPWKIFPEILSWVQIIALVYSPYHYRPSDLVLNQIVKHINDPDETKERNQILDQLIRYPPVLPARAFYAMRHLNNSEKYQLAVSLWGYSVLLLLEEQIDFLLTRGYLLSPFQLPVWTSDHQSLLNQWHQLPVILKNKLPFVYPDFLISPPNWFRRLLNLKENLSEGNIVKEFGLIPPIGLDPLEYLVKLIKDDPSNLDQSDQQTEKETGILFDIETNRINRTIQRNLLTHTPGWVVLVNANPLYVRVNRTTSDLYETIDQTVQSYTLDLEDPDDLLVILGYGTLNQFFPITIQELNDQFNYLLGLDPVGFLKWPTPDRERYHLFSFQEVAQLGQFAQLRLTYFQSVIGKNIQSTPSETTQIVKASINQYAKLIESIVKYSQSHYAHNDSEIIKQIRSLSEDQKERLKKTLLSLHEVGWRLRQWRGPGHPYPMTTKETKGLQYEEVLANAGESLTKAGKKIKKMDSKVMVIFELLNSYNLLGGTLLMSDAGRLSNVFKLIIHPEENLRICIRVSSSILIHSTAHYLTEAFGWNPPVNLKQLENIT